MKLATLNEKCPSPSSKNRQELQAFSKSIQKQKGWKYLDDNTRQRQRLCTAMKAQPSGPMFRSVCYARLIERLNELYASDRFRGRDAMQQYVSKFVQSHLTVKDALNAELQDGDTEPQGRNCLPFRGCFYARGVSALIAPTSMMNAGHNVVDRGHLLIQRELETDYLRLAFSPREATSEHNKPALVLPVGFIALVEMGKVIGGVQHHPEDASNCIHTVLSLQFRVWSRNLLRST